MFEGDNTFTGKKDCKTCPLKTTCIGKSNEKKIDDTIDKPLYDKMPQRLQTVKAKRLKRLRSSTVEPVIGTLVNYLGMKRVTTRGIEQANKCMLMAAVAYNLKKLMKFTSNKVLTVIKTMETKAKESLFKLVFSIRTLVVYQVTKSQQQFKNLLDGIVDYGAGNFNIHLLG